MTAMYRSFVHCRGVHRSYRHLSIARRSILLMQLAGFALRDGFRKLLFANTRGRRILRTEMKSSSATGQVAEGLVSHSPGASHSPGSKLVQRLCEPQPLEGPDTAAARSVAGGSARDRLAMAASRSIAVSHGVSCTTKQLQEKLQ